MHRRPQQVVRLTADDIDGMSGILINTGVKVVKNNPIKTSFYLLGLVLCLLFNGISVSEQTVAKYELGVRKMNADFDATERAKLAMYKADAAYRNSRGWFWTCDTRCQPYYQKFQQEQQKYRQLLESEREKLRDLKSNLGIFSTYGVAETRNAFNDYFARGKQFATRQSKWDALFIGIESMGRDEGLLSYILRVLFNVLFNFTIGMVGTVISFIYGLYGIITAYKAPLLAGLAFFGFASLAAISFAFTWVIGIYLMAAGSVYVVAKVAASNMRLQNGENSTRDRIRPHYD